MTEEKLGWHSRKQDHSECRHQPILVEEVRTCLLVSERPIGKFVSSFFGGLEMLTDEKLLVAVLVILAKRLPCLIRLQGSQDSRMVQSHFLTI